MTDPRPKLAPLAELEDLEVADGDPDVRGWDVISADGRKIGTVSGLLVDTAAMRVRYLDVDVDAGVLLNGAGNRHILVPIGFARLHQEGDRVRLDQLTSLQVEEVPPYEGAALTPDYERTVLCVFDPACPWDGAEEEGRGRAYDPERFYGSRGQG